MRKTETSVEVAGQRLPVVIEQVNDAYQATSPSLDGFLVLADTLDEVLALAPGVARVLFETMQAKGVTPPLPIEDVIRKAIQEYIQHRASHAEFRAALERATQENAELIAQLAES